MPTPQPRTAPLRGVSLATVGVLSLLACSERAVPILVFENSPASVSIAPKELSLVVGTSGRLTAQAVDSIGRPIAAKFTWSSANPAVAAVSATGGNVEALMPGTTTVTAFAGAMSATATVTVHPTPVAVRVAISSPALSLLKGGASQLTAQAYDDAGGRAPASFEWSSMDPAVATVGKTNGMVTGISVGTTRVSVTSGHLTASATVSVISIDGSFSFARWTRTGNDLETSNVLSSSADGTLQPLVRSDEFHSLGVPAWSNDGRLAVEVIHSYLPVPNQDWIDYNTDLYVVGGGGSQASQWRALTANGLSASPSWSPDGKRIAYLRQGARLAFDNDIYIIDADGGGEPVRVTQKSSVYGRPSWSPDGTRLVFTDWGPETGAIAIINADGTGLSKVTQNGAFDFDPSWSPDGKRIAFVSSRESVAPNFRADVFVVDVDGRNPRRLTSLPELSSVPAWSPDGQQIIFASGRALYAMMSDGSSLVQITAPPTNSWDTSPAWKR